jgi:hypothetical protein
MIKRTFIFLHRETAYELYKVGSVCLDIVYRPEKEEILQEFKNE